MDATNDFATMNDLPNELLSYIFKHLKIQDLIRCRLVCKRFMSICGDVKIPELIISNKIENVKDYWFYTNEQFNHKDAIDVRTFRAYKSTFGMETFLRRLHFKGTCSDFIQLNVNNLTQLQQLKINLDDSNDQFVIDIDLPNLEMLDIEIEFYYRDIRFHVTAPNLKKLKCEDFDDIHLTYSDSINHLETMFGNKSIYMLRNLQYIKVEDGFFMYQRNRNILSVFPKLTTLDCNLFECRHSEFIALADALRHCVKQKLTLKRYDLKIYFQSVELVDIGKIDEYDYCDLDFQINNYKSLCDKITIHERVDYNRLMILVKEKLPDDFFKKYFNIPEVSVSSNVTSQDHLLQFLKRLNYLNRLYVRVSLDQKIYDALGEIGRLTMLHITNCSITNYDFLFKLKVLERFSTTEDASDFFDLSCELFKKLKYFRCIDFHFENNLIGISRDMKSNEFVFQCRLLHCKTQLLHFDQLVRFIDVFRMRGVDAFKQEV